MVTRIYAEELDTLYSRSEEIFARCLLSSVPLDRLLVALSQVTSLVATTPIIPVFLRPQVLIRALRLLRDIESEKNLLDLCFAQIIPHPDCETRNLTLGELWELPREHEWLCHECGKPLYRIEDTKIS